MRRLDVLRLLGRRIQGARALILASYRDDEMHRAHPLRMVLGELATGRAVRRLEVAPLSASAVAKLAKKRGLDGEDLYLKTNGNPFFVNEVLATGGEEIPSTVRDAVLARAARLSPQGRELIEAAAVVPTQAEVWLLEALAEGVVDRLEECLASGMLIPTPDGVAFRHELARLTIEETLAPDRRLSLHRKAVESLATPPKGPPDLARLANHAEAGGDADAVLRFAPAAAARAASLGAYREAAAQYARALRFGDRLPEARRAELLERRSNECYLTDENTESIEAAREASDLYGKLGDRQRQATALNWLGNVLWCPGRTTESEGARLEALTVLDGLSPGRELADVY